MRELIPSKDVREYMEKKGKKLTDFERATLAYNYPGTSIGERLELLKEINRKSGITIVVVTHQMEVVKNICNKMTILSHGKLTISGEVKDIFLNHPETLQEVLGKSTEFPRKEGKIYLEIQQGIEGEKSTEYILSELAVQAGVNFNVVWGGMDRYRSSVAGNIVLEFPAEEKDKAQQYLDKRQIYWRAR